MSKDRPAGMDSTSFQRKGPNPKQTDKTQMSTVSKVAGGHVDSKQGAKPPKGISSAALKRTSK